MSKTVSEHWLDKADRIERSHDDVDERTAQLEADLTRLRRQRDTLIEREHLYAEAIETLKVAWESAHENHRAIVPRSECRMHPCPLIRATLRGQ